MEVRSQDWKKTGTGPDSDQPGPHRTATAVRSVVLCHFENLRTGQRPVWTSPDQSFDSVKSVLKYRGNWCRSAGKRDKGYLGAFSGVGYAWDRGLGFSLEAAPSWDADALFRMDKAGPRPSQDARETGLKEKAGQAKVT